MRLPGPDKPIPLPPPGGGLVVDGTEPPAPVWDIDAMATLLPAFARALVVGAQAPILRALLLAWGKMTLQAWADISRQLGAQQSPRFSAGTDLDTWGRRGRPRVENESEGAYRERLMSRGRKITPANIMGTVNAVVQQYLPLRKAAHVEPATDFVFMAPADAGVDVPTCFLQPEDRRLWATGPGLAARTAGAYLTPATLRAEVVYFIESTDSVEDGVYLSPSPGLHSFLAPAAEVGDSFFQPARVPLLDLIVAEVGAARGAGVVFDVIVDPALAITVLP